MMKKLYLLRILLVIAFLLTVFIPGNIYAATSTKKNETLKDLRLEYERLLKKQQENEKKTEQAKQDIAKKEALIKQSQAELTQAEIDYDEAEKEILNSNEKIEALKIESEKVLLYMQQMEGNNAYVEYVSGASSMTELITRVEAVKQVTGYIQDTVSNLKAEIKRNEELKIELEEKQKEIEKKIANNEAAIKQLHSNIDDYDEYAPEISKEVASAKQLYESYKVKCKQETGSSSEDVLLSACTRIPINTGWTRPLTKSVVTSPIGYRWGRMHWGIDLDAAEGTPVYATAAGVVSGVVYRNSCGGNMVFLNVTVNGQQYTIYYFHLLSYTVKAGDVVDQNTVIGYSGGRTTASYMGGYDTCSKGAHLHYGVAKGWYKTSIKYSNSTVLIPPPLMENRAGYRWTSRY
ncbi:MAG: peptidoglycan DD-metalloendopeptidase family protein [Bacilli bacterium]|jgi:murein DD-endopeptidase MepM/ murein hydrolase activator NlpD|nr:peptidoglycan DD-metalloendopeptidase family protein [Bacilli bacterium]MCX4254206.1 peptidoglycan DD-metalloendopeptidase family protein [Bacilli bacterium]